LFFSSYLLYKCFFIYVSIEMAAWRSLVVSSLLAVSVSGQTKEFQKEADPPLNCSATERAR
jgi:hypothetical protein